MEANASGLPAAGAAQCAVMHRAAFRRNRRCSDADAKRADFADFDLFYAHLRNLRQIIFAIDVYVVEEYYTERRTKMKVFITGATGFIGTHLVKRLAQTEHEMYCRVAYFSQGGTTGRAADDATPSPGCAAAEAD